MLHDCTSRSQAYEDSCPAIQASSNEGLLHASTTRSTANDQERGLSQSSLSLPCGISHPIETIGLILD